jgi:hypothetical protein
MRIPLASLGSERSEGTLSLSSPYYLSWQGLVRQSVAQDQASGHGADGLELGAGMHTTAMFSASGSLLELENHRLHARHR